MRLGADVDEMEALAGDCERHARRLSSVVMELDRFCASVEWHGPDGAAFRRRWHTEGRQSAAACSHRIATLASELRAQAGAQRATSAGRPSTEDVAIIDIFALTISGGEELVGQGAVVVRVEHLPNGRVAVAYGASIAGGVGVSGGSGVRLTADDKEVTVGALAGASAMATMGTSATVIIPDNELDELLTALARDAVLGPNAEVAAEIAAGIPGLASMASTVGLGEEFEAATYSIPASSSRCVEVGFTALASGNEGAGLNRESSSVDGAVGAMVGVEQEQDGSTRVYMRGSVEVAAAVSSALGVELGADSTLTVVLDREGHPVAVEVEVEVADESTVNIDRYVVDDFTVDLSSTAARLANVIRTGGSAATVIGQLLAAAEGRVLTESISYDVNVAQSFGIAVPIGEVSVTHTTLTRADQR